MSMKSRFTLSTSGQLLRNFVYLFFGNIGIRAVSFIVTIIIANRIGSDAFGQLNLAQALIAYFVLIADFGISLIGIREYVKTDKSTSAFVGEIVGTRVILASLSLIILTIFIWLSDISGETYWLLLLFTYSIPLSALSLEWFYRATEDMGKVAITGIIHIIVPTILLYTFVQDKSQIFLIPLFFAIGGIVQTAIYWVDFVKSNGFPQISLQPSKIIFFLKMTSLMGLSNIMIQVYYNLDTILLGFIQGEQVVGLYNAAYRLVILFTSIASIVGSAIFPRLSAMTGDESNVRQNRQKIMYLGARLLIYAILPIALLGSIYSDAIIRSIYIDEYYASSAVLRIIIWQVFTVFANVAFAFNLLASSNQRAYFYSVSAGAVINTVLNFMLIPTYSMMGAAFATIVAEIVVLAMLYIYARRLIAPVPIVGIILRCIALGAVLALIASLIDNLFLGCFIAILVYLPLLYLTRPFEAHEYQYFKLWRRHESD